MKGRVVLATDASIYETSSTALTGSPESAATISGGWIATSGHYGLRAHAYSAERSGRDRTTVVELRAVHWGLKNVLPDVPGTVEVWVDNIEAIKFLLAWKAGEKRFPHNYNRARVSSGKQPGLVQLRNVVLAHADRLTFCHVKGHAGSPLNNAADSLAGMAARAWRGEQMRGLGARSRARAELGLERWRGLTREERYAGVVTTWPGAERGADDDRDRLRTR